jgi:hypothetical protein
VRATTGFSASIATGELSAAAQSVSANLTSAGQSRTDDAYAKGVLALASIAPGLAPVVGARVGLGSNMEAGLTYTARAVRADARRSFGLSPRWSLSLGLGGTAVLRGYQAGEVAGDLDLAALHGWGADLPVLVGYASEGDLYRVWLGVRGGWEQVDQSQVRKGSDASAVVTGPVSLSARRLWSGGLLGLAVGFRHVHVAMEMDICYAAVSGNYGSTRARIDGITLAPASAVWWSF